MSESVTTANVSSDALSKQTAWIAKRDSILDRATTVHTVETDADLELAGWIQAQINGLAKEIEKARMEVTRPLDEVKKSIMAQERDMCARLTIEGERIKRLNVAYATRKQAEADAERSRIDAINRAAAEQATREQAEREAVARAEAQRKQEEARALFGGGAIVEAPAIVPESAPSLPTPAIIPQSTAPQTASNTFVTLFKFDVIDSAAVPRELCSVDETKIRAAVQYHKSQGRAADEIIIPGVRVYAETNVQSKRRF